MPPELESVAAETALRARSERLAACLESELETGRAADLACQIWRGARGNDRFALRCLMSLLEVRLSGVELLRQALRPTQLLRACRRGARGAAGLQREAWRDLVQEAQAVAARAGMLPRSLGDASPRARQELERRAGTLLQALLASRIREPELAWLTELAELELRATGLRLGDLAEKVGACDGRRISRLLPILSRAEERIRDTRALLGRLPAPQDLVRRTPVLMSRLEESGFDSLVRQVAGRPDGRDLARALVLVCWRAPLGAELAFLAGVVRTLAERLVPRGQHGLDPARAVLLTLQARHGDRILVELGPAEMRATSKMWEVLGAMPRWGGFPVSYQAWLHQPMLPEDLCPELIYPIVRRELDLREAVVANLQNEHILCGLLGLPRVGNLPGLVETVVMRSRSLKVLLEIANRRELFTGAANRNVPRALLWHPSNIPVSALRKFVHVRFVDRTELAAIASRGSHARPEVRQMASAYLASLARV